MTADEITVSNIVPGDGSVIATCDVTVGRIAIFGVTVRCGRGESTYINFPRQWHRGRWAAAVSILDADLLEAVRGAVVIAAVAANRFA